MIFYIISLIFIFSLTYEVNASCTEYITSYECTKHSKMVNKHEFAIYSDLTTAQEQETLTGGTITGIKDVDGQIAYMVTYDIKVASDNMFDENTHCERKD